MNPDELNTALADEVAPQDASAQLEAAAPAETPEQVTTAPEPKTYAGKYQSPEDLEKGYKELESFLGEQGRRLSDPEFIYSQAQKLGLTEAEAEQALAETKTPAKAPAAAIAAPQIAPEVLIQRQVAASLDYEKALDELPDLKTNQTYRAWAGALVQGGKTHLQAAKEIRATLGKATESARIEGVTQAQSELTEKERAATASQTTSLDTDATELAQLQATARNRNNPKAQEKAMVELMMRKNKAAT